MYEYTVPQEFNQDDRIGNFTMPQAMILGGGVTIFMLLLASGMNIILVLCFLPPIAAVVITLMYKKKYNIPIYEFALVYLTYIATPKLLIYRKENMRDEFAEQEVLFIEDELE